MVEVVGDCWAAYWFYGCLKAKLYSFYAAAKTRKAIKCADFILYVSKKYLQEKYPPSCRARVSAISNVDLKNEIIPNNKRYADIVGGKIVFGIIGSFKNKYKGIHVAIKSLAKYKAAGFDFELRILGEGDQNSLRCLAENLCIDGNIFFDGLKKPGEEVINWLRSIDIYMQPSLTEGLPRALIEAMSVGLPVLASNVGAIPELIDKEALCEPSDSSQLFKLILSKANDAEFLNRQSTRNLLVANQYRSEVISMQRLEFYGDFAAFSRKI